MTTTSDEIERSAALVARVHRLSDPLAAMGQRSPAPRLRRERNARVALMILTLGATLAITGAIAALADPEPQPDTTSLIVQTGIERPAHIRSVSS
jgi:hypothetical protein